MFKYQTFIFYGLHFNINTYITFEIWDLRFVVWSLKHWFYNSLWLWGVSIKDGGCECWCGFWDVWISSLSGLVPSAEYENEHTFTSLCFVSFSHRWRHSQTILCQVWREVLSDVWKRALQDQHILFRYCLPYMPSKMLKKMGI